MDMRNLFMGQEKSTTFQQKEMEYENKLLKEKLLQAEEKIRQLEFKKDI